MKIKIISPTKIEVVLDVDHKFLNGLTLDEIVTDKDLLQNALHEVIEIVNLQTKDKIDLKDGEGIMLEVRRNIDCCIINIEKIKDKEELEDLKASWTPSVNMDKRIEELLNSPKATLTTGNQVNFLDFARKYSADVVGSKVYNLTFKKLDDVCQFCGVLSSLDVVDNILSSVYKLNDTYLLELDVTKNKDINELLVSLFNEYIINYTYYDGINIVRNHITEHAKSIVKDNAIQVLCNL